MNTCRRPEGCTCTPGRIRDWYCSFYVPPPDPLETVQRWTHEHDGMAKDQDAGPWVRLEDVRRALGVAGTFNDQGEKP